jgi:hypothetical protein
LHKGLNSGLFVRFLEEMPRLRSLRAIFESLISLYKYRQQTLLLAETGLLARDFQCHFSRSQARNYQTSRKTLSNLRKSFNEGNGKGD